LAAFFLADFLVGFFLAVASALRRFCAAESRRTALFPDRLRAAPFFAALFRPAAGAPAFRAALAPVDGLLPAFCFAVRGLVFFLVAMSHLRFC
jgi:hypothetical protein